MAGPDGLDSHFLNIAAEHIAEPLTNRLLSSAPAEESVVCFRANHRHCSPKRSADVESSVHPKIKIFNLAIETGLI